MIELFKKHSVVMSSMASVAVEDRLSSNEAPDLLSVKERIMSHGYTDDEACKLLAKANDDGVIVFGEKVCAQA